MAAGASSLAGLCEARPRDPRWPFWGGLNDRPRPGVALV